MTSLTELQRARAVISPNEEQVKIGLKWCHEIRQKMSAMKKTAEYCEKEKAKARLRERWAIRGNELPNRTVRRDEKFYENLQQTNH